jgi:hypothetical protein
MDVDDLLEGARLPDVAVDADEALARSLRRGRARRRRRTALAGIGAAALVVAAGAVAVGLTGRDGDDRVSTGSRGPGGTEAPPTAPEPEPGDPATWTLDPARLPVPADTTFTAEVTRLGCHGGETGRVLRPGVVATDTEVIVTFTVEAAESGEYTCQSNDAVAATVDIGEPIGDRALVDGACRPNGDAGTTSFCIEDGGVRMPPPGS